MESTSILSTSLSTTEKRFQTSLTTGALSSVASGALSSLSGALNMNAGLALVGETVTSIKEHVMPAPAQDLLHDHGALSRLLLVYDESQRRLRAGEPVSMELIRDAACVTRDFVTGCHEKVEEKCVFPRLEKSAHLAEMIGILKAQHETGRKLTAEILALSKGTLTRGSLVKLERALAAFTRMYRPHEAFEETILFPELRRVLSPMGYREFQHECQEHERDLLGAEGFEGVLNQLTRLEKSLGINDLRAFTPKCV